MVKLNSLDVEELACKIVGLDYDEIDANEEMIEDAMEERYGISLDVFADILSKLLPMVDVGTSPISGKTYKGFADVEKQIWLLKTEK